MDNIIEKILDCTFAVMAMIAIAMSYTTGTHQYLAEFVVVYAVVYHYLIRDRHHEK